jgi:hypothetical protein
LPFQRPSPAAAILGRLLFIAALGILGATLILAFPTFAAGTIRTLGAEPWKSVGLGAGALVGLPVLAILLMVTVVGAAVGVAGLALYALALVAGFLTGAGFVGDAVLGLLRRPAGASVGATIVALLVGLIAISLVRLIPVAGELACLAVLLFGLGALLLKGYRAWQAQVPTPVP